MNNEYENQPSATSLSWSETWVKALTQPTEESYAEIVKDPQADAGRAYKWIFVSTLVGYLVYLLITSIFRIGAVGAVGDSSDIGTMLMAALCGAPIGALVSVLVLAIMAGITNVIASALGGSGSYRKLVYGFAAYMAPLSLVTSILATFPYLNCLTVPLGLYGIFLNVTAVKAVHGFGWGKAIASSVVIFALILVLVAILVIVVLVLLGPAIGEVFSNISSELSAP